MAYLFGASSGASFIESTLSIDEQQYSPVYDQEVDLEYLYQALPSFYREFMSDQEIFSTVWSGTAQVLAGDLLNLWQVDYAKSLTDVPIYSQRKWYEFEIFQEEDLQVDPELTEEGSTGKFVYNSTARSIDCDWTNRGGVDKATTSLRGTASHKSSLSWEVSFSVSEAILDGGGFVGYFSSDSDNRLSNTVAIALVGQSATTLSAGIIHYSAAAGAVSTLSAAVIDVSPEDEDGNVDPIIYTAACTYTASTGIASLTVSQEGYTKIDVSTSSTYLTTGGGNEAATGVADYDIYTNQFTDTLYVVTSSSESSIPEGAVLSSSQHAEAYALLLEEELEAFVVEETTFDDVLTTDDILVVDEFEYEIASIDGNTITTKLSLLPQEAVGLSYTIVGDYQVGSAALNIQTEAGDYEFAVDQFGVACIDSRPEYSATLLTVPDEGEIYRKAGLSVAASVYSWTFTDPTTSTALLSVPRLQDTVVDPENVLYEGTDYSTSSTLLELHEPPTYNLWAEYAAFDEEHISKNFGRNVDNEDASTAQYLAQVQGLYYAFWRGPTINALTTGIQIHMGNPVAEIAGTVESINPAYSGRYGQMVVEGRNYLYPLSAGTALEVGDEVARFQPLSEGVELLDYINSPRWFDPLLESISAEASEQHQEIRKYHTFLAYLDVDAFDDLSGIADAFIFVQDLKPTWKYALFVAHKDVDDDVDIEDDTLIDVVYSPWDTFCPHPDVHYGTYDFFGSVWGYDWAVDQGEYQWDYATGSMVYGAWLYTRSLLWTDTEEESPYLEGELYLEASHLSPEYEFLGVDGQALPEGSHAYPWSKLGALTQMGVKHTEGSDGSIPASFMVISSGSSDFVDSGASFLTDIPNTTGTPDEWGTFLVFKVGDDVQYHRINSIIDDQTLDLYPTGPGSTDMYALKGTTGITYEIRGPGNLGLLASGVGDGDVDYPSQEFSTSASVDFTALVATDDESRPVRDTYLHVTDHDPEYLQVLKVVSATALKVGVVASLSSKNWLLQQPTPLLLTPTLIGYTGRTEAGSNTLYDDTTTYLCGGTRPHPSWPLAAPASIAGIASLNEHGGGELVAPGGHDVMIIEDPGSDWIGKAGVRVGNIIDITAPTELVGSYEVLAAFKGPAGEFIAIIPPAGLSVPWLDSVTFDVRAKAFQASLNAGHTPEVGDLITVTGAEAGTYEILEVNTDSVVLDHDFSGTEEDLEWFLSKVADEERIWAMPMKVEGPIHEYDKTKIIFPEKWVAQESRGSSPLPVHWDTGELVDMPAAGYWSSSSLTPISYYVGASSVTDYFEFSAYKLSMLHPDYKELWFDWFLEICPDETVELEFALSAGAFSLGPFPAGASLSWDSSTDQIHTGYAVPAFSDPIVSSTAERVASQTPTTGWSVLNPTPITFTGKMLTLEDTSVDFVSLFGTSAGSAPATPIFIVNEDTIGAHTDLPERSWVLEVHEVISATQILLKAATGRSSGETAAISGWPASGGSFSYSARKVGTGTIDDTRKYVVAPDGAWYEVDSVSSDGALEIDLIDISVGVGTGLPTNTYLTTTTAMHADFEASYLFCTDDNILPTEIEIQADGTIIPADIALLNGALVDAGAVVSGDYGQIVPTPSPTISNPVDTAPVFKIDVVTTPLLAGGEIEVVTEPPGSFQVTIGSVTSGNISPAGSYIATAQAIYLHLTTDPTTSAAIEAADEIEVGDLVGAVITIKAAAYGAAGNLIGMSCTAASSDITVDDPLSGGLDGEIAAHGGSYSGSEVSGVNLIRRVQVGNFPMSLPPFGDFDDWINQGPGDTIEYEIKESVAS